jgi:mono/diheme cytochrome c family protein
VVATVMVAMGAVPALAQDAALVQKGQEVYGAQKCARCHAVAGKGNAKGPLDKVGSKLSVDDIRKWIVSPKEMRSEPSRKPDMPAYPALPAPDLDALVAYMRSLKG